MLANPGLFKRSRLQWLLNTATLKLPLTNSDTLDSRITATRASTKTYFDSTGTMRTAAINEFPREYDPSTLVCLGRSFWEARTNGCLRSEEFDHAAWSPSGLLAFGSGSIANAATAPDGQVTADKIVEDTSGGVSHRITTAASISLAASTAATFSLYVKAGERSNLRIQVYESSSSLGILTGFFNLATGQVTSTSTSGTASGVSASIQAINNGWYRCVLSGIPYSSGTACGVIITLVSTGTTVVYTGDGASGLYIWGAQLEAGATPTPYIPTTSASATRSADVVSMTGTNFSSWFNATEGTFSVATMVPALGGAYPSPVGAYTDASNFIAMLHNSLASYRRYFQVSNGGVTQCNLDSTETIAASTSYSAAMAYKANDFAFSRSGEVAQTDTSGTIPTVTQLYIGQRVGSVYYNGFISRITYWPARLSNTDLQILSRST